MCYPLIKSSWVHRVLFSVININYQKTTLKQYESHPDSLSHNLYPMFCNSFLALRLWIPESNSECHPSAAADLVFPACHVNFLNKFGLLIFSAVT